MIEVGSFVTPKFNLNAEPAEVKAIDDLGHGPGKERVKIQLRFLLFGDLIRYYALEELAETRRKPWQTSFKRKENG